MEATHGHPPDEDPGGGVLGIEDKSAQLDQPEIKDTSSLGGWIWIILFGGVILISLFANLLLTVLVVRNRKKHNLVYFIHLLLFALNLLDYSLLIFEFSLGIEHEYPYNQLSCTIYQVAVKGNPILQAIAILIMLFYAAKTYSTINNHQIHQLTELSPMSNSPSSRHANNFTTRQYNDIANQSRNQSVKCSRTNDFILFGVVIISMVVVEFIFSLPTAFFASIVTLKDKRYCEIDLSSSSSSFLNRNTLDEKSSDNDDYNSNNNNNNFNQTVISVYYILYSSILSLWLPLLIAIIPIVRLIKDSNRDKYPEVSVVLSTVSSFFILYIFHATLVFVRHFHDISGQEISTYNLWMIKVGQSLLWLIAYFWHFTRPALALSLDSDLKQDLSKLIAIREYGSLPRTGIATNAQPTSNANPVVFARQQNTESAIGKWRILSGAKHVITNTLLGHHHHHRMGDINSLLTIPLNDIEKSVSDRSIIRHHAPQKLSEPDKKSVDEENPPTFSQDVTTPNVGENNC